MNSSANEAADLHDARLSSSSSQPPTSTSKPTPSTAGRSPRRGTRGTTTPLGFSDGDPCPRLCGGVLREAGGRLRCANCPFQYPEGPDDDPFADLPPHVVASIAALREAHSAELLALRQEVDEAAQQERAGLLREIEELRDTNLRLIHLVQGLREGASEEVAGGESPEGPKPD